MTSDSDFTFVKWCSICSSEPAVSDIEMELDDLWRTLDVGQKCLTRMEEAGMIE